LRAVGPGASPIRFGSQDLNFDGKLDKGTLLRDSNNQIIGDQNGDTFFDGPSTAATVVVDGSCPPGSIVAPLPPHAGATGGSSFPWLIVSIGVAAAVVVVGGGVALFFLRRQASRRTVSGEPG
jgi:hypothetical protein